PGRSCASLRACHCGGGFARTPYRRSRSSRPVDNGLCGDEPVAVGCSRRSLSARAGSGRHTATGADPYRPFDGKKVWIMAQESELVVAADKWQIPLARRDRPVEITKRELAVAESSGNARQFER